MLSQAEGSQIMGLSEVEASSVGQSFKPRQSASSKQFKSARFEFVDLGMAEPLKREPKASSVMQSTPVLKGDMSSRILRVLQETVANSAKEDIDEEKSEPNILNLKK